MRNVLTGIACTVFALTISQTLRGGEPAQPEAQPHRLRCRFAPVGGWNPYGGGLFHWWNPNCFALPCGPDDYDRKPIPRFVIPSAAQSRFPRPGAAHVLTAR